MPQSDFTKLIIPKIFATLAFAMFFITLGLSGVVSAQEYWQQQVDYQIDVTLSKDGRTISGSEILIYTNNSPDTLHVLYLKAFANSARKGSLMDKKRRDLENYSIAESDPSQWGHAHISNVRGRSDSELKFELDDTIYKIYLQSPIAPGATARISLDFETKLPVGIGDRHELVGGQSKAAYWYPQACVYDRKVGWVDAPYLGRGECYGDFGDFEVSITAPEDRIVVATGLLGNRPDVLPDSLRNMLDISNFLGDRSSWPKFSFDSEKTKTWKFFAKRVNDFAWVASADFCMDEGMSNGIQLEVYARRSNAKGWVKAIEYAARSEQTFSELYGNYGWPVITVTDSYDGMEYPMITFCSGGDPSPTFPLLVYHEIGHFWFMGLVGSNQVDRACLDEGFTTMAEIVAMEKYHGRRGNNTDWSGHFYKNAFYKLDEDRDARGYRIYLEWVRSGYDHPMIIPSDNANEYWAYRNSSYYKPVVMHFTLRSIFGDEIYFAAMKRYGTKWFFKHPYEDDFIETFSRYVDQDLDQYFAQWYTSRRRIDYAYEGKKHLGGDTYEIKLSKPGDFVTPIDVALITNSGDTSFYTVNPEGHTFVKDSYHDAGIWRQYRQPSREYSFSAIVTGGVSKVVVDPYNLLPDINRLNNSSGFLPPIETRIDAMFYDQPSMHEYSLRLRPDLWYDQPNGLIIGGHAHGSYINTDYKFSLDAGIGTESERALIDFKVSHPFRPLGRLSFIEGRLLRTDFRTYGSVGLTKEYRPRWTGPDYLKFRISGNYFNVDGQSSPASGRGQVTSQALPFLNEGIWSDRSNAWAELNLNYLKENRVISFSGSAKGRFVIGKFMENSGVGFTTLTATQNLRIKIPNSASLTLSASRSGISGQTSEINEAFLFHVSRSSPLESYTGSRIFRSPGAFPKSWREDFYLDDGGLRGYQDRSLYGLASSRFSVVLGDIHILSTVFSNKFSSVGRFISRFNTELFLQTAWVHLKGVNRSNTFETQTRSQNFKYYSSAGISFVSPSVWNGQQIRFDFPVYLSRPLPGEEKWDFRFSAAWILPLSLETWP